jgi:hypothetical protein
MFGRLLCLLGFHRIIYPGWYPEQCARCAKPLSAFWIPAVADVCDKCGRKWIGWHKCPESEAFY